MDICLFIPCKHPAAKRWILYLPSRTLGGTPFTGPRPLYATGITNNAQGGGEASTTLTTHLDLLCEPSTMLFFFSPSSTPSQLLLHQLKVFVPRAICSTFAASTLFAKLLHPNTLQKPPFLSLPQNFLSLCHPVHTLASPGVGQDPLCSSLYTPHTRTNDFHALLPYYFIPVPFLCSIPASNFPNTTPPKM